MGIARRRVQLVQYMQLVRTVDEGIDQSSRGRGVEMDVKLGHFAEYV